MTLVGIKVELGGNFTLAQFAVDEGRRGGRITVVAAVHHAHRACLGVKLEYGVELYVNGVAVAGIGASDTVGHRVSDREGTCEIDVAGLFIEIVNWLVSRSHRTRSEQGREMGTRRHRHNADLIGAEAALRRLGADHSHRALTVSPRALPDR